MEELKSDGALRIEAKDLRCKERQPLQDLIPLSTPFVIYIEPTNACNFRCKFCPTSDPELLEQVGRPLATMPLDKFKQIVDGIKGFPEKLKLLSLYKDGEPLVHKHFPAMVRYAKDAGISEKIWTKTNGAMLNPEFNARLVDIGLDLISISVEAVSSEGYRRIAGVDIDYDQFRKNLEDLYQRRGSMEVYVKIADSGLSQEEIDRFYADFGPLGNFIAVEKLMGWSYSGVKDFTLGTNPDTYDGLPLVQKNICAYPFYVLAVNANGSVSVCGNDWSHSTNVGNAFQQTLPEIWRGKDMALFQKMMIEGRRCDNRACADCYYLQIVPDNLDPYQAQLTERLAPIWQSHS